MNSSIVIVVDQLSTGFLGPYGNAWVETPEFNQLACESILYETALAESIDLLTTYRSYWQGMHALEPATDDQSVPERLLGRGVATALLTDDEALASSELADGYGETIRVPRDDASGPANSLEDTQLARVFAGAIDWLDEMQSPFHLWVHAGSLGTTWDAPLELRARFADEEDPDPFAGTTPPSIQLADDHDPDEVLSVIHAYAAEILVADACLGALLSALARSDVADETLVSVTSPRGFALGEHRIVGSNGGLFGEMLATPWLVRRPDGQDAAVRVDAPVQPSDMFATLLHWHEVDAPARRWSRRPPVDEADSSPRPYAVATADGELAVRAPAWFARILGEVVELYAKPDDRWEFNEIADRCRDEAQLLAELARQLQHGLASGGPFELPPLDRSLQERVD